MADEELTKEQKEEAKAGRNSRGQQLSPEDTAPGPQGTENAWRETNYDDVEAQYTRSDDIGFLTESVSKDGKVNGVK